MIINEDLIIGNNYSLKTLCEKVENLEKHITPVILWQGDPTTNNLTLNGTATNYKRIKIYYMANGIRGCTEISDIVNNNKYSLVTESEGGIDAYASFNMGVIYFSGKSLIWFKNNCHAAWTNNNDGHSTAVQAGTSDWYATKIYKVEGYYN